MKEELTGQGSFFINRLGNVFMSAPMFLMYLTAALLGIYTASQFMPALNPQPLHFGLLALMALLFYGVGAYVSLGHNYHDIIVGEGQIRIVNRIPGFRRQVSVPLKEVEEVLIAESHIDLDKPRVAGIIREVYQHPERKWMEIKANGRRKRWNCYGLNDGIATGRPEISTVDELIACLRQEGKLSVRVVRPPAA